MGIAWTPISSINTESKTLSYDRIEIDSNGLIHIYFKNQGATELTYKFVSSGNITFILIGKIDDDSTFTIDNMVLENTTIDEVRTADLTYYETGKPFEKIEVIIERNGSSTRYDNDCFQIISYK